MLESGFDLSWAWGIGLIGFSFGVVVGIAGLYLMLGQRQSTQEKELAAQLIAARQQFDSYREQVGQHFMTTSDLVQKMTSSYRDVYDHLASGSQTLCPDPVATPQLDIPLKPVLQQENSDQTLQLEPAPADEASGSDVSDTADDRFQKTDAGVRLDDRTGIPEPGNETRH